MDDMLRLALLRALETPGGPEELIAELLVHGYIIMPTRMVERLIDVSVRHAEKSAEAILVPTG